MKTACLPLIAALSWAMATTSAHASVPERAGEVTFMIGEARITQGPESGSILRRGSAVHPGQQIETSGNGHLHIRFVDGAAVAVRPMTRLRIDDYSYVPNDPNQNRIRFFLQEGALRSITGKAGEANKDHFRINTPVAAIGIRGTDFNVQTTGDLTRASLFQGAIVLSPLGGQCSVSGLGPCVGSSALELNEQRRSQFAIQTGGLSPVAHLVPKRLDATLASSMAPSDPSAVAGETSTATQPITVADARGAIKHQTLGFPLDGVVNPRPEQVTDVQPEIVKVVDPAPPGRPLDPLPAPPPATAPPVIDPPAVEPPLIREIALTPEIDSKIWWVRWAAFGDPSDVSSTVPARYARPSQLETAGISNGVFRLLRPTSTRPQLPSDRGVASFALSSYDAYTRTDDKLTRALVTSGSLTIDFGTKRFATSLGVAPAGGGIVDLSAVGRLEQDGRFRSDAGSRTSVDGAIANQGQQAGYGFQHLLAPGTTIQGATAWTR